MADPPAQASDSMIRRGVVAVVVRDARFLVIRRSAGVVAPRAFCFPGGGIEAGESEEEALVREFQEELGAVIQPVRRVWTSVTPWQVQLAWWLGQIVPDALLIPNPSEVESVHWFTPRAMHEQPRMLPSNRDFLEALSSGTIVLD
jgi:8-oxo-dGTP diphosphatase